MATANAIADVIDMFIDAPLSFIPRDTNRTSELWLSALADIPDTILRQAGRDYVLTETEWPAPAKLYQFAKKVKVNNGTPRQSAFVDKESHPRAAPLWTRKECDRLESVIGYLLKKPFPDWTDADRTNYENAIGTKLGSEEEHRYWNDLYAAAYYFDGEGEADKCTTSSANAQP